jgi:hypothetical protein
MNPNAANYYTLGTVIADIYAVFLPRYGDELASVITALVVDSIDDRDWN